MRAPAGLFARSVHLSFTALRSTPALLQVPPRPRDTNKFVLALVVPFRAASVPLRYVALRRTHRALPCRSLSARDVGMGRGLSPQPR